MSTSEKGNGEQAHGNGDVPADVHRMEDFLIPEYILNGEQRPADAENLRIPSTPVLVFINGKSGGQLGKQIIPLFRALLSPKQVHELPNEKPDEVLREFYERLNTLEEQGDQHATEIRIRLRLIVAGGDGTHGWLLGVVSEMGLEELPPISTIPLGTGNNLPYSFGWGKRNPHTTTEAMREILQKTAEAQPMQVDRWRVVIRMSKPVEDSPLTQMTSKWSKLHNLIQVKSFSQVSDTSDNFESGRHSYQGGFWNYLSIGMDSQVSYAFHHMRQDHPEKFKNQRMNQSRYAGLAWSQGWFCASCTHPTSRNIKTLANIFIAGYDGEWHKVDISPSIRSIIILNLPSFSGGINPWGTPGKSKAKERGLTAPYVNDGLIEIVGLRDGWHGLALVFPGSHGTRLAQAHKVRVEFHKGGMDHTYMRVDGEPWLQNLPPDDKPTVMEITHIGQAVALAYGQCVSKPIPRDVLESSNLPISTASFNSVLETESTHRGSTHQGSTHQGSSHTSSMEK